MRKKKIGIVKLSLDYVVDLDNYDMVEHAKDALYEDIWTAIKYNEINDYISVEISKDKTEKDIPEFLKEEN
jgi:hypothetical protein